MYPPAESRDTGIVETAQIKTGSGVFYGIFCTDGADLTIEAFDGTADTDARIWVGEYEFATLSVGRQPSARGVSFTKGLFIKYSAAPTASVVHFA